LWMAAGLIAASAALYVLHFALFRDAGHIFIYGLGELAFLPLEVLVVTLIIDRLLHEQEKKARLKKVNMVVGAFFSEMGLDLLREFAVHDGGIEKLRQSLPSRRGLSALEPALLRGALSRFSFSTEMAAADLKALKDFLKGKRDFSLRLLENPTLLEHESFTGLLMAVFHLTEELEHRPTLKGLPGSDYAHLAVDVNRAYAALAREWFTYLAHLRGNYPYLLSLAVRNDPFESKTSVIID